MSFPEAVEAEVMYTCDACGKRFNSVDDAQIHDRNAHRERALNDDSVRGL